MRLSRDNSRRASIWLEVLEGIFSLSGMFHQPSAHPNPDVRIDHLISVISEQGFTRESRAARELLKRVLRDLGNVAPPHRVPTSALKDARRGYQRVSAFNRDSFRRELRRRHKTTPRRLLEDLLQKRPVILDAASLFTLVSFSETSESDEKIPHLVADFLRLNDIASRFHSLGLRG
jgi:hypothetical protein